MIPQMTFRKLCVFHLECRDVIPQVSYNGRIMHLTVENKLTESMSFKVIFNYSANVNQLIMFNGTTAEHVRLVLSKYNSSFTFSEKDKQ